MRAIIISIGDELLIGQVVNTNAAFIAEKLNEVSVEVHNIMTIPDDESEIYKSFRESFNKSDIIIATGGLGPTHDDVTRSAVCKFFNAELYSNAEVRVNIEKFLRERNRTWSDAAESQTLVPRGVTVITNKYGTAPGLLFEKENKYFIVMPGVPHEMESMMNDFVVPFFQKRSIGKVVIHRTLKTNGIPESVLAERLGNIKEIIGNAKLAFLPSPFGVRLRISIVGSDFLLCESKVKEIENKIRDKAGKYIYGVDNDEMEEVVGRLLKERKLRIAAAESCTGGLIANRITNVSGSSSYLERTVVVYSNESKIDLLNVPKELIEKHGAVSKEVAKAMASGIRKIANVDIGISTTGIAGPTGGTPQKPVGLVWIGYSDSKETIAQRYNFGDDRIRVKERASQAALELVRRKLLNIE